MTKKASKGEKMRSGTVEKKGLILEAAEKVFARQGLKGTRLLEIANEAGLPKANLLYYFQSKEDIYRAVCRDILETWLGSLGEISADDNPKKAIERYIKSKMDRVLDAANRTGHLDNTYVVFLSDHGEMNMEHRQVILGWSVWCVCFVAFYCVLCFIHHSFITIVCTFPVA